MGSKCDHTIAYCDSFVVQSKLIPTLLNLAESLENNATLGLWSYEKESYELIKFLDGRKGYMTKFKFCPNCGERIDWKAIKNDLKFIQGLKRITPASLELFPWLKS